MTLYPMNKPNSGIIFDLGLSANFGSIVRQ